jgi:taurine dioxygenase
MMMKFDLSRYRHIEVNPVNGAIGAEIGGIDASAVVPAVTAEELRQALAQFQVIFFREQQLDKESMAAFARNFGQLGRSPLAPADAPLIGRLHRAAETPSDVRNNGDRWHTDRANDDWPAKGFVLYCEEAPPYGGDTLFASLCQAYDALPSDLQDRCRSLTGVHSMSGVFDLDGKKGSKRDPKREGFGENDPRLDYIRMRTEHPLVCRHPDSGRSFLFVTGAYLIAIKELSDGEGSRLIEQLNQHVVRPEFTCRFRWRRGSIAVLDNRCTQHYAVSDYAGFTRSMLRAELSGDWRPLRAKPALLDA